LRCGFTDIANLLVERGADLDRVNGMLARSSDQLREIYETDIKPPYEEFGFAGSKSLLLFSLLLKDIAEFSPVFEPLFNIEHRRILLFESTEEYEIIGKMLDDLFHSEPKAWPNILTSTANALHDSLCREKIQKLLQCGQHSYQEASIMVNLFHDD
jgi:hypothetical protein